MKTLYACLSGLCLFIIAIGINRFSYAAILPYLVNEHWLTLAQAGYVGSANYLGYFLGALLGNKLIKHFSMRSVLVVVLFLSLGGSVLSIFNLGFVWLLILRCVVGLTAGILMVLSPTVILAGIHDNHKHFVSGLMYAGIGIGIGASCLLTPLFAMTGGVARIWEGMAILTLILGAIAFQKCARAEGGKTKYSEQKAGTISFGLLLVLLVTYMLYAIGLTPILLFLSDYVHRSLGASTELGALVFAVLGLGAMFGSIVGGWLFKKVGGYVSVLMTILIGLIATLLLVFNSSITISFVSAFLSGFYLVGMVVLMSIYLGQLAGMAKHSHYWAMLTLFYAVIQFVASYGFAYGLSQQMTYKTMFAIGAVFLALSFVVYLFLVAFIPASTAKHNHPQGIEQ